MDRLFSPLPKGLQVYGLITPDDTFLYAEAAEEQVRWQVHRDGMVVAEGVDRAKRTAYPDITIAVEARLTALARRHGQKEGTRIDAG